MESVRLVSWHIIILLMPLLADSLPVAQPVRITTGSLVPAAPPASPLVAPAGQGPGLAVRRPRLLSIPLNSGVWVYWCLLLKCAVSVS